MKQTLKTALALLALTPMNFSPTEAADPDRPIIFSLHAGALSTDGLLNVSGGWYPVWSAKLHTDIRPWIGYYLDFMASRYHVSFLKRSWPIRLFHSGISPTLPLRTVKVSYKVGYGVTFTGLKASTLFVHGLRLSYAPSRRWRAEIEGQNWVPNDWFQPTGLSERYKTWSISCGGGVCF